MIAAAGLTALALGASVLGASAFAQTDLRVLRQRNEILQQQDIARQNSLAAQRELSAAQSRYATQLTLRGLDESASPPTEPSLRPALPATPPRGSSVDDMAADIERMDRLTDERLAASNARLRAIKPAS
jgi:type II secretory pathway pseudopilin PulG